MTLWDVMNMSIEDFIEIVLDITGNIVIHLRKHSRKKRNVNKLA